MAKTNNSSKMGSYTLDVVLICIAVVVIIISSVMIIKQFNKYSGVEAKLNKQQLTLINNKAYLKKLQNLSKDKEELEYAFSKSEKYIPGESKESEIMDMVTEFINDVGGTVEQIRFENYKTLSGFSSTTYSMPFSVLFNSNYPGLVSILDRLNSDDRIVVVKRVNVVKKDNLSDSSQIKVEISAECYYQVKKKNDA